MSRPKSQMMVQEPVTQEQQAHQDFGKDSTLGKIGAVMGASEFGILIDLVTWARLWDGIYMSSDKGKLLIEWDDATIRALMFPFIGFGNNPRLYNVVSDKVNALIGRELPLWLGDPNYRKANSMVWCVLQSLAPTLANGYTAQQEIVRILSEGFNDQQP